MSNVKTLIGTLHERASYLRSMVPEGLSEIERQSMQAMEEAANELDRLELAILSIALNIKKTPQFSLEMAERLCLHVLAGGTVQAFVLEEQQP